ncbi:MAG: DUF4404 family protein [Bdellovibrionales bacterium]|nr:DUF4404 family protein [Bdellovibrionales bacterium]
MPITKYYEVIEVLKVAVDTEDFEDTDSSDNLRQFISSAQVDSDNLKDPTHRRSIEQQATDLVTEFEASNPKVSAALHDVIAALQALGI